MRWGKTLFCLASCSKAFLATSVGLLIDDYANGKNVTPLPSGLKHFDWDTKLIDILPKELEWSLQDLGGDDWATREMTIADALGHVGGLPRHDHSYLPGDTSEDVVRRMRFLRTSYELREKWSYNNQVRTPRSTSFYHTGFMLKRRVHTPSFTSSGRISCRIIPARPTPSS